MANKAVQAETAARTEELGVVGVVGVVGELGALGAPGDMGIQSASSRTQTALTNSGASSRTQTALPNSGQWIRELVFGPTTIRGLPAPTTLRRLDVTHIFQSPGGVPGMEGSSVVDSAGQAGTAARAEVGRSAGGYLPHREPRGGQSAWTAARAAA